MSGSDSKDEPAYPFPRMPSIWYEAEAYIEDIGTFTLYAAVARKDAAGYGRRWIRAYQTLRQAGPPSESARHHRAYDRLAALTPAILLDYLNEDDRFTKSIDHVIIQRVTCRTDHPLAKESAEVMGILFDPDGGQYGAK